MFDVDVLPVTFVDLIFATCVKEVSAVSLHGPLRSTYYDINNKVTCPKYTYFAIRGHSKNASHTMMTSKFVVLILLKVFI